MCASESLFNGDLRTYTLRRMIAAPLDGAGWKMQPNLHVSRVPPDGTQLSGYLSQQISTIGPGVA